MIALIFADFCTTISNFLSVLNLNADVFCQLDGFLRNFGELSGYALIIAISNISYKKIMDPRINPKSHFKKSVFLAFSLGFVTGFIPIFGKITQMWDGYVHSFLWCSDNSSILEYIILPLIWVGQFVLGWQYWKMMKTIRRFSVLGEEEIQSKRIIIYPVIFMLSWTLGLVNVVYQLLGFGFSIVLTMGQIIGIHTLGFTNGLYYGLSRLSSIKKVKATNSKATYKSNKSSLSDAGQSNSLSLISSDSTR